MTIATIEGSTRVESYETWQDASRAAKKLGVAGVRSYFDKQCLDPRLPANPERFYVDFPGWSIFVDRQNKEVYLTIEEASLAAYKLRIFTRKQYEMEYSRDPRLPSNPREVYMNFFSWKSFLGMGKVQAALESRDCYPTWMEAQRAVISKGVETKALYDKLCAFNARLPLRPDLHYADFPGWEAFLSQKKVYAKKAYLTWKEASKAAVRLEVFSKAEYEKKYSVDPKLPSNPRRRYADFPGWEEFLRL